MIQEQIQISKIKYILDSSNDFYQDLLGYIPEQTSLQSIPKNQWFEFTKQRGLNPNSSGIYLPRNQTAIIQEENPLSLFHEYFGHGLYCEQSLQGRRLVDLEKKLLEEEKQEFQSKQFTLEDIQGFRTTNKTFQELEKFIRQNLAKYELFAIRTEYLLSREFGLGDEFERKYDSLEKQDKEIVDPIINFLKSYGNLAIFYASGLARKTTPERVRRLLGDVYGDRLQDVRFSLLYGSRKEFSDIDVFVVSNSLPIIKNHWLDVSVYSIKEFEEKVRMFDIEITDPLKSGEIMFGDIDYFTRQKRKLTEQPITKEAIQYNLSEAEDQEKSAYQFPEDSEERRIGLSYASTSKLMAKNLKRGKRFFTKEDLFSYSERTSVEDGKPLQL